MDVENWRFVVKCFSRNGKKNLKNIISPHFKNCLKKLPRCQISISKTKKTTWLAGDLLHSNNIFFLDFLVFVHLNSFGKFLSLEC
jgi:hypothetical protein